MRIVRAALWASLLLLALPAISQAVQLGGPITLPATVTRVVDGDTIHVSSRGFDTTVRLLGIDTPETKRPETVVECGGPAASRRAEHLLRPGQPVTLVTDPTQATRDRFGRLLAYVSIQGREVNRLLVERGYACVLHIPPDGDARADEFTALETAAKAARRGLWGACDPIPCN